MSNIQLIHGNIFTSPCQTLVNTVNCVGIMGAGIAFEFRLREPDMFHKYVALCGSNSLDIGKLWLYRDSKPWVLNFPTKKHWKFPSKESYLHSGLEKFKATYRQCGITSVAFPLLGASKGGIHPDRALSIMTEHLKDCEIPVEIYQYDPLANDDLFQAFRINLTEMDVESLKAASGIRSDKLKLLIEAASDGQYHQMNQLMRVPGIGEGTLEKLFRFVQNPMQRQNSFGF